MMMRRNWFNGWNTFIQGGLHEEWIDYNMAVDADGREFLCPYCAL